MQKNSIKRNNLDILYAYEDKFKKLGLNRNLSPVRSSPLNIMNKISSLNVGNKLAALEIIKPRGTSIELKRE
jgi:hypothetical protein